MEFLTKDFNPSNNSYPINLVLQSREAAAANYDASKTANFIKSYLPFNPTTDFHEYRIDYLPDKVLFYADGAQLAQMNTSAVPTEAGRLILQHWSNGNPLWSGGPPEEDAVLQVRYVKAYFNSSDITRQLEGEGEVCGIPEITPDNHSAAGYFFSDHANMTNNQTVWGKSAGSALGEPWEMIGVVVLLTSGWLVGMW
jgi:beta-glucanase (GH16 family)